MKRKMKFITKITMVLLMVIGCLSYRSVFAEEGKLNFSIDSTVADSIEGDLVVDLYRIADIVWDGTNKEQTTYLLHTAEGSAFKDDLAMSVIQAKAINCRSGSFSKYCCRYCFWY